MNGRATMRNANPIRIYTYEKLCRNYFVINTCTSCSKKSTYNLFRIRTYQPQFP